MELKVFDNYNVLSAAAAEIIVNCIRDKPDALLCFASGDTPKLTYQLVAEIAKKEAVDISQCFFIGLDEWMGIPPENTGSCHYFLQQYLFSPIGMKPSQVHLFNALNTD